MQRARKTISFSKNTLVLLFRSIADILEEDSNISNEMRLEILNRLTSSTNEKIEINNFFDQNINRNDMEKQLGDKSIEDLKSLVQEYSLDPKNVVRKWNNKKKIIDFILERRLALLSRFEGF